MGDQSSLPEKSKSELPGLESPGLGTSRQSWGKEEQDSHEPAVGNLNPGLRALYT